MTKMLTLKEEDLIANPSSRLAICLVLDTSGSMRGDPIRELNDGVRWFFNAIKEHELCQWSAEICLVEFNDIVKTVLDFGSIHRQSIPALHASGTTAMAQAVNQALDLLANRKKEYKDAGVDYYQPWMVLMTDGEPTDSVDEVYAAIQRTSNLIKNRKLTLFPIGIGQAANLATLKQFSPKIDPLRLTGLNFKEFFEWLMKAAEIVSRSTPGDKFDLPKPGFARGWDNIDCS